MSKISRRTALQFGLSAATLTAAPTLGQARVQPDLDAKLATFFEDSFTRDVNRSPLKALRLGLKQDMDKLDDNSDHAVRERHALMEEDVKRLNRDFPVSALSAKSRTEVEQFKFRAGQEAIRFEWRDHFYPLNTTGGAHVNLPITMINDHKVETAADAEAYISRLTAFEPYFNNVRIRLDRQDSYGVRPPKFFFPIMLSASTNQVTGKPFDQGPKDAPLYSDIKAKIAKLSISDADKAALVAKAEAALKGPVARAYGGLIDWLTVTQQSADDRDGVWKLPNGDKFYSNALRFYTTTGLTADQIHEIGLSEVKRIHLEMKAIMDKVGFKGSLQDFFKFMREDDRFYHPDTPEGKAAYLKEAVGYVDAMRAQLGGTFGLKPKAPLEVRMVEPFREGSAASAFYNRGTADGKRPGIFYVNLSNMRARPRNQIEGLVYHEGIPGHHMQLSIAQELPNVPRFQSLDNGNSAFAEGWALYTEQLGKEMGFYTDPYSDFGRLTNEVWRAIRLVVDTGMHAKKWTKEQATDYFVANSSMDRDGAFREVHRYIGDPGQATAYKIGMIKILDVRAKAKAKLGSRFTLPGFHDAVLGSGSVPLDMLERQVSTWTKSI
jgi:uncharacterized protein (DUF885 family)